MSNIFWRSFLLLFITTGANYAQKHVEPSSQDLQLAEDIHARFEDDEVALVSSTDYITFDLSRDGKQVTATQTTTSQWINLTSRADIQLYDFYDGESDISEFNIFSENQKRAKYHIIDEAYHDQDLFHNDARVKHAHLDFPVKAYRYETRITKNYQDIKYFTGLYLVEEYPILKKEVTFVIPSWLQLDLKGINFEGYEITKTEKQGENANQIVTFTATNVPSRMDESHTPGPSYLYPNILILPKSFENEGQKTVLFNDTSDLYSWYRSLASELENDNSAFRNTVAQLTAGTTSEEEKIRNIYYWIQDNIRYIAFEDGIAGFKPDEASNVYKKRYGDCKGMANLTKQMLTEAGFDARLTWLGTDHIAYDYSTPNLSVDNHMICTVMLGDEMIFLDGTEKFNSLGEYNSRIQGQQMLIEDGENFILTRVPVTAPEFNSENAEYDLSIQDEEIVGSVHKSFSGQQRSELLYYFHSLQNDRKDDFLNFYLSNGSNNIEVSNIQTSDLTNRDSILEIAYDIRIKNAVSSFGNTIYLDLDIDKELGNMDFKDRKVDYQFDSRKDLLATYKITIPDGLEVSAIPEAYKTSTEAYDLNVSFDKQDQKLIYKKHFRIKNARIKASDFENWNKHIQQLNNIYNEQITFSKN